MKFATRSWICGSLLVLSLPGGCKNNDEGAAEASTSGSSASDSGSEGSGSGGGSGSEDSGSDGGIVTTTDEPEAPTGGEPVACDSPESCTAMAEGDLSDVTVPFFRGKVCLSDQVRPGDPLTIAVWTCAHPCLTVNSYAFSYAHRDDGDLVLAVYHEGVSGSACPSDVFGQFDVADCQFAGPVPVEITPPMKSGAGSLLLPFLSNEDAAAIAGGESGAALWARADAHAQAPGRTLAIEYAADNAAPPAKCDEGVAGCTCSDILLD